MAMDKKGQGDNRNLQKPDDDEDNENSWASSSESEVDLQKERQRAVADKWKQLYGGETKSKTPTPEPVPDKSLEIPSIDSPAASSKKPVIETTPVPTTASFVEDEKSPYGNRKISTEENFISRRTTVPHPGLDTLTKLVGTFDKSPPKNPIEERKTDEDVFKVKNRNEEESKVEASVIYEENINWSDSEEEKVPDDDKKDKSSRVIPNLLPKETNEPHNNNTLEVQVETHRPNIEKNSSNNEDLVDWSISPEKRSKSRNGNKNQKTVAQHVPVQSKKPEHSREASPSSSSWSSVSHREDPVLPKSIEDLAHELFRMPTAKMWTTNNKLPNKSNNNVPEVKDSNVSKQENLLDWSSSDDEEDVKHNVVLPVEESKPDAVTSSENLAISNSANQKIHKNSIAGESKPDRHSVIKNNLETLFLAKSSVPITVTKSSSSLNLNSQDSKSNASTTNMEQTSNMKKPQAVVTAQPNLKDRRPNKYNSPVPYSKLVLPDPPAKLHKHLGMSSDQLDVQKVDSLTAVSASTSKSVGDLSSLSSVHRRKPFFSRLKNKLSKITRSSSSKSTLSIKSSISEISQHSELKELESEAKSELDPIEQTEQQQVKLLLMAKTILEKRIRDRDANLNALLEHAVKSPQSETEEFSDGNSSNVQRMESKSITDLQGISIHNGCCDDAGGTAVGPMPLSKYCDAIDPCNPDPDVIRAAIEDLSCVCHKLAGENCSYKQSFEQYECEIQRLRQELECCQQCKTQLEQALEEQDQRLQVSQMEFDEVVQSRMNLEAVASTMKDQLSHSHANLLQESEERTRLEECIQELEMQLRNCCETLQTVELEKQELLMNCQSHQQDIQIKDDDCCGLREALAKCCEKVDCLQQCVDELNAELCRLRKENMDFQHDKERYMLEQDCQKSKCEMEIGCLNDNIAALQGQIDCLVLEKNEVCRKCNEIVQLHHAELDCVKAEAEKLARLYEEEKRAREDLEKRLRDCEDQKAQRLQQHVEISKQTEHCSQQISELRTHNETYRQNIHTLEQERTSYQGARQCLEQQLETAEAEKVRLQTQLQELQSKHQVESEVVKATFSTDEHKQVQEKLQRAEVDQLEFQNENKNLKETLQKTEAEKTTVQYENEKLVEELQEVKAEKNAFSKENEKLHEQLQEKLQVAEGIKIGLENERRKFEERLNWAETERKTLEEERKQLLLDLETKENEKVSLQILLSKNRQNEASKIEEISNLTTANQSEQKKYQDINIDPKANGNYELKLEEIKNQCKREAEAHYRTKLEHAQNRFEKQLENRTTTAEDPNGNNVIMAKLTEMNQSLKHDTKKLKKMVKERDEHIIALEEVIKEIKNRYSETQKELRLQKIRMQGLQTDLERQEAQSRKDTEELERENIRISRERKDVEKEKLKLEDEIRMAEKEKLTLQSLGQMKDRIESEVVRLKAAISQQLIDRSELEKMQEDYEAKLSEAKNQFDAQLEMNRQLAEINEYLGKQSQDRAYVDKLRDENENILRKELNSVSTSLKLDTEKLKNLIKERDQEIRLLRKAVSVLKMKYATEAQSREELMKKVQILSTISQESLANVSNSNNNISRVIQTD